LGLRAVASQTTDPHVSVRDINLSFRKRWWSALDKRLREFAPQVGPKYKIYYKHDIDRRVDGWAASENAGHDGYLLVQVRRRLWWRQGRAVLRLTGVRLGYNSSRQPTSIECLLYDPEHTEAAREMLANIGRELYVRHDLTLYRYSDPKSNRWKWLFWFMD
jgi:hypothetical protein